MPFLFQLKTKKKKSQDLMNRRTNEAALNLVNVAFKLEEKKT